MNTFHQEIKQNVNYLFLQKLITPIVNILLTIYIVRKLTITDFGIYNLIYAFMGYITLFSSMGLLNSLQRFIPEFYTKKEYSKIRVLFNTGLILRLALAIIFIMISIIFSKFFNQLFKVDNFNEYIQFFFLGIIFYLEVQVVEVILSSLLMNKFITISYLITTLIRAGFTYFFLEKNMGLNGLFLAETIYFGLLLLIQILFYFRGFSLTHPSSDRKLSIKRLLRYSGFSYLDEIGWTILDVKTDFFIISTFLGPTFVGLYAFADQVIETVSKFLPFKIARPLIRTVFFSKFSENSDQALLNRHFNFLVKIIAFFSFPIFWAIFVFGDKIIIYLFDAKYLPSLSVLRIFTAFMMIVSFQFPLQLVVQAVEKVEITFFSKIFSIYNLIGDLLMVQIFGILGVAIVTCSARLFQFIFVLYRIRKFIPLAIDYQPIIKIFSNSLLMIAGLYLLKDFVNNTATLILFFVLGVIFYSSLSCLNRSFLVEEREFINKLLPRPIFIF